MSSNHIQLGAFGEQEVRSRLERALQGTVAQLSGFSDHGIDLVLQYPSPAPDKQPLHFGVQVKCGDSYVNDCGSCWQIKNIGETRFYQWQKSKLPVLFVWVRPSNPSECYWQFIRKNTNHKHFLISKKAIISPSARYDFALEYFEPSYSQQDNDLRVLRAPLSKGLRLYAKMYYRRELMPKILTHPLLGNVKFTWKGWKHITSHKRPVHYVHRSMQLLSVAPWVIENAGEFVGLRRLRAFERGEWVTEIRLVAFKSQNIKIQSRPPANVIVVLHEQIQYPKRWENNVLLHQEVKREVSFESIYEKYP